MPAPQRELMSNLPHARYRDLLEAIQIVSRDLDTDRVLEFVLQAACRLSRTPTCSLILVDAERRELYFGMAARDPDEQLLDVRLPLGQGIAGQVIASGDPKVVPDVSEESSFDSSVDRITGCQTKSIICLPLTCRGQTLGALEVVNAGSPGAFSTAEVDLLTAFASQAALAIDNARRYGRVLQEREMLQQELDDRYRLVCPSEDMAEVMELARKAAQSDSTVLVQGESGTGKELIARAIHGLGPRHDKAFVAVNCATLSEELLESELFGHERGAFTGAHALKKGKLETVGGGTFFLDEVGELKGALQARFLRVLQERVFERVGGTRPIPLRCRIVCATNRDLGAAVAANEFRRDLYFRINVIAITVPPLRERRAEIGPLAEFFLERYRRLTNHALQAITPEAMELLARYDWPGNVRELENVIERATVLANGTELAPDDLPAEIRREGERGPVPLARRSAKQSYAEAVREMKRVIIREALVEAGGHQKVAAGALQIQPSYLSKLIKDLGLRDDDEA